MTWDALTSIATTVSMIAFIATALYVRGQLRGQKKDRYLNVTNDLFKVWHAADFMEAQLWLLHRLEETTWRDFVAKHRGDVGEVAFHRVGAYYDRVGTLVRLGFVNEKEILSTIGGYAIAVWSKVGPLVKEARRIENSTLFDAFERLLPACHECYVPALAASVAVAPFSIEQPAERVATKALARRLASGEAITVLDVRHGSQVDDDHPVLPGTLFLPADEVEARAVEIPDDRPVAVLCA